MIRPPKQARRPGGFPRWVLSKPHFAMMSRRIVEDEGIMVEAPLLRLGRVKEAFELSAQRVRQAKLRRPLATPAALVASA